MFNLPPPRHILNFTVSDVSARRRRPVVMGPGCVERGSVSAPLLARHGLGSRSWSADLRRIGSLTAPDALWGVCWHWFERAASLGLALQL